MSQTLEARRAEYIPGIDGLRALSVLAVLMYHMDPAWLPGGFVGVDVFFVISGFVVTLSVKGRSFSNLGEFLLYFYRRRLLRIIPALLVMLMVVSLLTVAFIPDGWLSSSNRSTALSAFLGLSNVQLALRKDGYFDARADFNPFVHTWSLGVEEQFYLLFPFVFAAFMLINRGRRDTVSIAPTVLLTVASLLACVVLTRRDPVFAFFELPTRFWELGAGVLLAATSSSWQPRLASARSVALHALAALSMLSLGLSFMLCDASAFPFPWALQPVIASALLLMVCSARRGDVVSHLLASSVPTFLGKISYSLYLWHWPIYVLLRWTIGLELMSSRMLALIFAFLAGTLSYRFIEQWPRRAVWIGSLPRAVAVGSVLGLVVVCGLGTRLLYHHGHWVALSVTEREEIWSPYRTDQFPTCSVSKSDREVGEGITLTALVLERCPQQSANRMFVVGDLHAGAYQAMLADIAHFEHMNVDVVTTLGCPFLTFGALDVDLSCSKKAARVLETLRLNLKPGDIVFLPSLRVSRYRDQYGGPIDNDGFSGEIDPAMLNDARKVLESFVDAGAKVILEAPTPVFKSPPFRCVDWFDRSNPICALGFNVSRVEIEHRRSKALSAERAVAAEMGSVSIWDPTAILCSPTYCDAFKDGIPLFFDGDHLSGYGNKLLFPDFRSHLRSVTS